MATILGLLNKVKQIDLPNAVPRIIEETESEYIKLNQMQLYSGFNAKGEKITPGYSSLLYATEKHNKNPLPGFDTPDLNLTGSMYRKMYIEAGQKTLKVYSDDSKTDKLVKQYGESIFGLTPKNKTKYAKEVVYVGIKKHITQITGLKFG